MKTNTGKEQKLKEGRCEENENQYFFETEVITRLIMLRTDPIITIE